MENTGNRTSKVRAIALVSIVAIVLGLYAMRLFQIQIVEGDYYAAQALKSTSTNISIAASRGEILDRYMRPMVVNRTSYSVVLDQNYFPRGTDEEQLAQQSDIILGLTKLLTEAGETWNDSLPISRTQPYTFDEERPSSVANLKSKYRLAEYATAENCMDKLVEAYGVASYTPEEQRTIVGVQYEMQLREFSTSNPYTFATGVSKETVYVIKENNRIYPGVDVQTTPIREYVSGSIAPHIIGTIGPIYEEEYAELKDKGYAMNDTVGKSGIESAMESVLRGTTGTRTLIKDAKGNILEEYESKTPVPGSSVILTLDAQLQDACQNALAEKIAQLRTITTPKKGGDVKSGSVVVLDVKTGGVLACASWPFFDLSTYNADYEKLVTDPEKPLFNRALNGAFVCGSVMKPIIATAGLMEGVITPTTTFFCNYYYEYYAPSYRPACMHRHGSLNVSRALYDSCNVFFFETGRLLGIDRMNRYSTLFGLGQKTGVEIGEASGILAGPAYRTQMGGTWNPGDTIQAAIGQSDNQFTPIQLAAAAMTIANGGVRYKTHFVHSIRSYDGTSETLVEPEIAATVPMDETTIRTIQQAMEDGPKRGTAVSYFRGIDYTVATKTGTAQTGVEGASDHGAFIGYAPVDNPEIAIAVLMENGTSAASGQVARKVFDAYFAAKSAGLAPTPEGELLP